MEKIVTTFSYGLSVISLEKLQEFLREENKIKKLLSFFQKKIISICYLNRTVFGCLYHKLMLENILLRLKVSIRHSMMNLKKFWNMRDLILISQMEYGLAILD